MLNTAYTFNMTSKIRFWGSCPSYFFGGLDAYCLTSKPLQTAGARVLALVVLKSHVECREGGNNQELVSRHKAQRPFCKSKNDGLHISVACTVHFGTGLDGD